MAVRPSERQEPRQATRSAAYRTGAAPRLVPGKDLNNGRIIVKALNSMALTALLLIAGTAFADDAKSLNDYKAEAQAAVRSISVREAMGEQADDAVLFIDVREAQEIERLGKIEGAVHVPRGLLEFVMDKKSPMHMDEFSTGKKLVFYCATDGRSMLAAKLAKDMGAEDPVYIKGGFRAWSRANR